MSASHATATDTAPPDAAASRAGGAERMRRLMRSRVLMAGYMATKFPAALFGGLRVDHVDEHRCEVSVPYGWRSRNPFQSTYFAVQAMAGELSSGALVLAAVQDVPGSIATVITDMDAQFTKKATSRATFTCEAGAEIIAAAERASETGEPVTVRALSVGRMADGTEVARMHFTWSLRRRDR